MPWRRQSARHGATGSALLAIVLRRLQRLRVRDQRVDLLLRPVDADSRHLPLAVADDRLEALPLAEQRVAAELGTDERAVEPVADEADALELLLPELLDRVLARGDEGVVLGAWDDLHEAEHLRVLDPAELGAHGAVLALRRLEPRVVRLARDRVDLAAEVRHPPAVVDVAVGRVDPLTDDGVGRRRHRVDRDGAVRIAEEPVELVALDDDRLLARGARVGR